MLPSSLSRVILLGGGTREPIHIRAAVGDGSNVDGVLRGGSLAPVRRQRRRYHRNNSASGKWLASEAEQLNALGRQVRRSDIELRLIHKD